MLKKLILLVVVIAFVSSISYAQGLTPEQKNKIMKLTAKVCVIGDAIMQKDMGKNPNTPIGIKFSSPTSTGGPIPFDLLPPGWITSITYTPVSTPFSEYDLCSNGSPNNFIQDPASPNKMHAILVQAPVNDPTTFPGRRAKYYYSTNYGSNWTYVADCPAIRAGFAAITLLADGRELIVNHNIQAGGAISVGAYVDAFAGSGSFNSLDPGATGYEWPRVISTSSITNTKKYKIATSTQNPDSGHTIIGTNLTTPGTFLPWVNYGNFDPAEKYKMARGSDGRIGLVFSNDLTNNPADAGCVFFLESTNNGTSFSTPLKIFQYNMNTDSLFGGWRGIDIVYRGNIPCVTFDCIVYESTNGYYYNHGSNCIKFWSTILPGSDPNRSVKVADSTQTGYHPHYFTAGMTWYGLTSMCDPVIGRSGNVLFIAFATPFGLRSGETYVHNGVADTASFFGSWLAVSGNGGLSWKWAQRISPVDTTATIKDWNFPSISPTSDSSATTYYANIMMYTDPDPILYVDQFATEPPSNGQYVFARVAVTANPGGGIGIRNISNEIPDNYKLYQNYPNPFNPTTNIRFALPKASLVTLKVYNISGQLIETVMKGEMVTPGVKEAQFDGSRLSSGIYFYTLEADNFKVSKKMILIK